MTKEKKIQMATHLLAADLGEEEEALTIAGAVDLVEAVEREVERREMVKTQGKPIGETQRHG